MEKGGLHSGRNGACLPIKMEAEPEKQVAKILAIQNCIQSLVHACQCRDGNCRLPSCQKMKPVVQHTKRCKLKTSWECSLCKYIVDLICYHAKLCQVPETFCVNLKVTWKFKQLQHRLQEAQLLKQQMVMKDCGFLQAVSVPTIRAVSVPNMPVQQPQQQAEEQQQPGTSHSIVSGATGGSGNSLEEFNRLPGRKQLLPSLKFPNTPEEQAQMVQQQQAQGTEPNKAGQVPGGVMMVPNQEPQHVLPQQQQSGPSGSGENSVEGSNPHASALKQVTDILNTPNTPEQQAKLIQILQSNPQLTAAIFHQQTPSPWAQLNNQIQAVRSVQGSAGVVVNQQQQPGTSGSTIAGRNSPEECEIEKDELEDFEAILNMPQSRERVKQIYQVLKAKPRFVSVFRRYEAARLQMIQVSCTRFGGA